MDVLKVLEIFLVFLFFFLVLSLVSIYSEMKFEKPLSFNSINEKNIKAPSNFIDPSQIEVYPDKIVIKIQNAGLGRYASTGSMIPILDENTIGIRITPKSEEEINVGDIITFKKGNQLIVHRVIEKGNDEEGTYFITEGDNNNINDGKIRFPQIEYVTVGLIY